MSSSRSENVTPFVRPYETFFVKNLYKVFRSVLCSVLPMAKCNPVQNVTHHTDWPCQSVSLLRVWPYAECTLYIELFIPASELTFLFVDLWYNFHFFKILIQIFIQCMLFMYTLIIIIIAITDSVHHHTDLTLIQCNCILNPNNPILPADNAVLKKKKIPFYWVSPLFHSTVCSFQIKYLLWCLKLIKIFTYFV